MCSSDSSLSCLQQEMDSRIHQEDQERRGQEHLRQQHRLRLLPRLSLEVGEFAAAQADRARGQRLPDLGPVLGHQAERRRQVPQLAHLDLLAEHAQRLPRPPDRFIATRSRKALMACLKSRCRFSTCCLSSMSGRKKKMAAKSRPAQTGTMNDRCTPASPIPPSTMGGKISPNRPSRTLVARKFSNDLPTRFRFERSERNSQPCSAQNRASAAPRRLLKALSCPSPGYLTGLSAGARPASNTAIRLARPTRRGISA